MGMNDGDAIACQAGFDDRVARDVRRVRELDRRAKRLGVTLERLESRLPDGQRRRESRERLFRKSSTAEEHEHQCVLQTLATKEQTVREQVYELEQMERVYRDLLSEGENIKQAQPFQDPGESTSRIIVDASEKKDAQDDDPKDRLSCLKACGRKLCTNLRSLHKNRAELMREAENLSRELDETRVGLNLDGRTRKRNRCPNWRKTEENLKTMCFPNTDTVGTVYKVDAKGANEDRDKGCPCGKLAKCNSCTICSCAEWEKELVAGVDDENVVVQNPEPTASNEIIKPCHRLHTRNKRACQLSDNMDTDATDVPAERNCDCWKDHESTSSEECEPSCECENFDKISLGSSATVSNISISADNSTNPIDDFYEDCDCDHDHLDCNYEDTAAVGCETHQIERCRGGVDMLCEQDQVSECSCKCGLCIVRHSGGNKSPETKECVPRKADIPKTPLEICEVTRSQADGRITGCRVQENRRTAADLPTATENFQNKRQAKNETRGTLAYKPVSDVTTERTDQILGKRTDKSLVADQLRENLELLRNRNHALRKLLKDCRCASSRVTDDRVRAEGRTEARQCREEDRGRIADLAATVRFLQHKCRTKDGMIAALADELKRDATASRADRVLDSLADPTLSHRASDFDRSTLWRYLAAADARVSGFDLAAVRDIAIGSPLLLLAIASHLPRADSYEALWRSFATYARRARQSFWTASHCAEKQLRAFLTVACKLFEKICDVEYGDSMRCYASLVIGRFKRVSAWNVYFGEILREVFARPRFPWTVVQISIVVVAAAVVLLHFRKLNKLCRNAAAKVQVRSRCLVYVLCASVGYTANKMLNSRELLSHDDEM